MAQPIGQAAAQENIATNQGTDTESGAGRLHRWYHEVLVSDVFEWLMS